MNLMSYAKFALLAVLIVGLTPLRDQQTPRADGEVRQLLVQLKANHRSTEQLAVLFQIGDAKIADLIKALSDPDTEVSLGAQIVIRYLGNEQGMDAWRKLYEGNLQIPLTGPIPIPLSASDYNFIKTQYLKSTITPEPLMDAYLFALALDGSPQATKALSDVIANGTRNGFNLHKSRYLAVQNKTINDKLALAAQVLQQATFLDSADRAIATAKVIAYSGAKDKALVEIHVNRGSLSQEWYHVVLRRVERGWATFSITQVAVS